MHDSAATGGGRAVVEPLEPRQLLATNGLNAVYFNNRDFTGAARTRIDSTVAFDWPDHSSPARGIRGTTFAARWSGLVKPYTSETYTFTTRNSDGVRLWVNGKLVIDAWTTSTRKTHAGTIALKANRLYDLRLEYFVGRRTAAITLFWSAPSRGQTVIATSRLFAYDTRSASIGDFGRDNAGERDVARLMRTWKPEFITTVGDNNYEHGAASTIDRNVGKYFHDYIAPYTGAFGPGSKAGNRFFPALGNHDVGTLNGQPYLDYFKLPGNERYYSVLQGNTELFVLNSNTGTPEPDGTADNSIQAKWLRRALGESVAQWKVVLFHHAAYSSSDHHGNNPFMQWPFQQWGATAVIAGHDHTYERIMKNNFPYFVNGLGGRSLYGFSATPQPGSAVRFSADYGAMRVDAHDHAITFRFITRAAVEVDSYTVSQPPAAVSTRPVIRAGDTWKYLDNGTNPGAAWRTPAFDDSAWASGAGELGYNDGDETTTVGFGGNASNKFVTTYFRKAFTIENAGNIASLNLQVLRDDGVAVYVNGTEVFRNNLAAAAAHNTFAQSSVEDDNTFIAAAPISAGLLSANGNNVIAVEVHQSSAASSDLSFDLFLTATFINPVRPPATPSALRATVVGPTQVNLTWIDTVSNESGFQIERSTDGLNFTTIGLAAANATTFTASLLLPATQYWFRVRAYNPGGVSPAHTRTITTLPLLRGVASVFR